MTRTRRARGRLGEAPSDKLSRVGPGGRGGGARARPASRALTLRQGPFRRNLGPGGKWTSYKLHPLPVAGGTSPLARDRQATVEWASGPKKLVGYPSVPPPPGLDSAAPPRHVG